MQKVIIHKMLEWLESSLQSDLTLNAVSQRSGYSKWHLQREFKKVTGKDLGHYIRVRRLSKAALALRLTRNSIYNIAKRYGFDSQQAFTRAFTRQFGLSPSRYRQHEKWDMSTLHPPLQIDSGIVPQTEFMYLTHRRLSDLARRYSSIPWRVHPPALDAPHIRMMLSYFCSEKSAVTPGRYAVFRYAGPHNKLLDFVLSLYDSILPLNRLSRREGSDLKLVYAEQATTSDPGTFRCDYLIPIIRLG
ncbi:TPA: helix-turn-helix domain-containing protein [Serratia marcescens]